MCLAQQGPQRSDLGEARTSGLLVLSQALYHCTPNKQREQYLAKGYNTVPPVSLKLVALN